MKFARTRSLHHYIALLFLAAAFSARARDGAPPVSRLRVVQALDKIARHRLPPTDARAEQAADALAGIPTPLRYAAASRVEMTPATHGTWEALPDGRLWRLRFNSEGATDLNFGFTTCWLPEGATLHISSENEAYSQGPYTARDNKPHGELWTPVVPGDSACIELFVPAGVTEEPRLVLSHVGRGYRDLFRRQQDLAIPKAGTCELDVICPAGDPWRNEIRSVALYSVSGSALCTGTLIMDAAGDFKNYFLTANHCGISAANASTVVVYWNFQSPSCGSHGGGSMGQNQSGATFRASKSGVDFALIELEDVPDSAFNVYYAGWDRSGTAPGGAVGIHHPNADEKSISISSKPLVTVNNCTDAGTSTHWNVSWNTGVTEVGSSGSGIWDPATHLLVGTLSGGSSSCAAPTQSDCYGKFSIAWASGTSASSRLRDWLDPSGTGVTNVPGRDPGTVPILSATGFSLAGESCLPANGVIDSGESVTLAVALRNTGGANTSNMVATLIETNGVLSPGAPQTFGMLAGGGASATRNFSFVAAGACGGLIQPTLHLQDGTNSLGTLTTSFRLGSPMITFTQRFDTVSSPNLPAGWVNAVSGTGGWTTTTVSSQTTPNSAFAADPGANGDATLTSPAIAIVTTNAQLTFAHRYATESGFDGGVLELSINGGAFVDLLTAGGSFVSGGYNATISTLYNSPIAGRNAWSGNSATFVSSVATLPASTAGRTIRLRWRMASDDSISATGWYVDSISLADGYSCCRALVAPAIVNTRKAGANVAFSYATVPGQSYIVETRTVLTNAAWIPLTTNAGDGSIKSHTNSTAGAGQRIFRLKTQ